MKYRYKNWDFGRFIEWDGERCEWIDENGKVYPSRNVNVSAMVKFYELTDGFVNENQEHYY